MADVTGTIGSEQVELKNASTEETLLKCLASLKTLNQSILKTSGSGGGGADAVDDVTDSLKKMSPITAVLSKGFSMVTGVLGGLIAGVGVVAGAFVGLAEKAMDNQAKMSDFYGALGNIASQIPIFGGVLGGVIGLFQKMAAMQEVNLAQYQKLTTAGINFGGSLTDLRLAASKSYMSFEAFSNLMVKNSTTFARMGGNVNDGAEAFAKMSNELLKSPVGDRLLALGYTTDQVNQGMADYISMTGGRNAQEMKNTKSIISSSAAYMEQLDGLAQLTGKNRAEMAEEMKKKASVAAFQAKLATMSEEERNKATIGMANAMAAGGEGAVDAFQAQVMGVAVQTKAGQAFTGMYSEGAEKIRQSADMVYDGNKSQADMNTNLLDTQDTLANEQKKYGEQTSYALQMQGGAIGQTSQAIGANVNQINQSTRAAREEALKKKSLTDTEAAEIAKANKSMQEFGQQIMGFLTPIIKEMTPYMTDVLAQFKLWMKTVNLPKIGEQLGEAMKKVMEYMKNFFTDDGQAKIINDIKYLFGLIGIEIKRALLPNIMYSEKDAEKDREKLAADKAIYDASASAATNQLKSIAAQKELDQLVRDKAIDESQRKLMQAEITKNADAENAALTAANAAKAALVAEQNDPMKNWGANSPNKAPVDPKLAAMTPIERIQYQHNHPLEGRASGSIGATGKLFENFGSGKQMALHGTEAVVTPEQMTDMMATAMKTGQDNNLVGEIQRLNTLTAEMLRHIKDTAENTKRTVEATRSLSGNLF